MKQGNVFEIHLQTRLIELLGNLCLVQQVRLHTCYTTTCWIARLCCWSLPQYVLSTCCVYDGICCSGRADVQAQICDVNVEGHRYDTHKPRALSVYSMHLQLALKD